MTFFKINRNLNEKSSFMQKYILLKKITKSRLLHVMKVVTPQIFCSPLYSSTSGIIYYFFLFMLYTR